MGVLTNLLKLLKPGENDYYNQQTEQADNWQKVDDYAVLTNADKNGIWGGEFGGYIQDPIPKELNKRYIDNINGKAFICIKAGDSSVVSNTIEYFTPCNVVDNLDKLQNLAIYAEGSVTPWPGFHVIYDTPYILGNTFNFNIGTYSAPLAKQTLLGTVKTKPTRAVTTSTFCAIPGIGIIGSIVVRVETNGNILIIENTGVDPNYLNSNASYYVEFSYIF